MCSSSEFVYICMLEYGCMKIIVVWKKPPKKSNKLNSVEQKPFFLSERRALDAPRNNNKKINNSCGTLSHELQCSVMMGNRVFVADGSGFRFSIKNFQNSMFILNRLDIKTSQEKVTTEKVKFRF